MNYGYDNQNNDYRGCSGNTSKGTLVGGSLIQDNINYKDLIGFDVCIKNINGEKIFANVLDVKITTSLTDKKNLFLLLPLDIKEMIEEGSVVYNSK